MVEVKTLRRLFISFFSLAFIFVFHLTTFADEGHSHDSNIKQASEKFRNGVINNQEVESENHGHSNQTTSKHDTTGDEGTHEEDSHGTSEDFSEGSEEHHGPIVETPPNYKVLGTYGAINLSFILIGVWNKWFRRKEDKF